MEKPIQSEKDNNSINLKGTVMEDFVQYMKPSMFLISSICNWKCCVEAGIDISVCQNQSLAKAPAKAFSYESLWKAYHHNDITKAIVIGGLEPMMQFEEVIGLLDYFREHGCLDDFVIYTGYYAEEIEEQLEKLKKYPNVIVKFGRFIPDGESRFDEVLGITLVSKNQYAERIS